MLLLELQLLSYNWKSKYGGMEASGVKRLKELEDENRRLKPMYAELSLEYWIVRTSLKKSYKPSEVYN